MPNNDHPDVSPGSITQQLRRLQSADAAERNEAALEIWRRYVPKLLALARRHLDARVRRREDEHDVVQDLYASFCRRQERGEFALDGRDELWQVLVTITLCKARNTVERHRRQRRDYRREEATTRATDDSLPPDWLLAELVGGEPTPAEAAALNEEFERRLESLSPPLRQVALWKLEGYTHEEIAAKLGCSKRSVIRKVGLIRGEWDADS